MDIPSEYLLFFIFFLIILSAFFSGSETALTAISRAKIHKLKQKGSKNADCVTKLRSKKESLIGGILIGNNLVNILASAIATKFFMDSFGDSGVAIATVVMTLVVVIFAEVLPKTYAIYNAEKLSLLVAKPLAIFIKIFSPFANLVQKIVNSTLKLFGIDIKAKQDDLITAIEELRATIELHHKEGGVLKHDKDMLDSVLDLAETEVETIMVHRKNMLMVNAEDKPKDIIETILKSPHTRIPIWKETKDNIIGVLHAKELLKAYFYSTKDINDLHIEKIASEPWFIPETTTLRDQLIAFRKKRSHFAIVVDEYGAVLGIVTLEDILEEIVGNIKDEFDKGALESHKRIGDDTILVQGSTTLRDLNRDLDIDLPEDDASTVAGLILNIAEKIPDRDEVYECYGFKFTVVEKKKQQITKVQIAKLGNKGTN